MSLGKPVLEHIVIFCKTRHLVFCELWLQGKLYTAISRYMHNGSSEKVRRSWASSGAVRQNAGSFNMSVDLGVCNMAVQRLLKHTEMVHRWPSCNTLHPPEVDGTNPSTGDPGRPEDNTPCVPFWILWISALACVRVNLYMGQVRSLCL